MNAELENPYVWARPIKDPEIFFGREEVLEKLRQGLHSRIPVPIVLWGPSRIGKSTILCQLKHKLRDFEYVYVDPRKTALTFEGLLQEWANQLAITMGQDFGQGVDEASLQNKLLPTMIKAVRDQKKDLVCLFDELGQIEELRIEEPKDSRIMRCLSKLQDEYQVRMVFAATWPLGRMPRELIKGEMRIAVGNLDSVAARNLIVKTPGTSLIYDEEAINRVIHLTGGHPNTIQHMCFVIWASGMKSTHSLPVAIDSVHVDAVISDTIERARSVFESLWSWIDIPSYRALLSFVASAQQNSQSFADMSQGIEKEKEIWKLQEWLVARQDLIKQEILEESIPGDRVRFKNELFRQWVNKENPWEQVQMKGTYTNADPTMFMIRSVLQQFESSYRQRDVKGMEEIIELLKKATPNNKVRELEHRLELYKLFMQARQSHAQGEWQKAAGYWQQMLPLIAEKESKYEGIRVDVLLKEANDFQHQGGSNDSLKGTKVRLRNNTQKLLHSLDQHLEENKPTEMDLELINIGDHSAWGKIIIWRWLAPWLDVPKPDFCCLPGETLTVTIKVQPSKWRPYLDFAFVWPGTISIRPVPPRQTKDKGGE